MSVWGKARVLVGEHRHRVIVASARSVGGFVLALLTGGPHHRDPGGRIQTMPSSRIQQVVTMLLTDEVLRLRFAHDRLRVLGDLQEEGAGLTANELQLFMLTDAELWWWTENRFAGTLH